MRQLLIRWFLCLTMFSLATGCGRASSVPISTSAGRPPATWQSQSGFAPRVPLAPTATPMATATPAEASVVPRPAPVTSAPGGPTQTPPPPAIAPRLTVAAVVTPSAPNPEDSALPTAGPGCSDPEGQITFPPMNATIRGIVPFTGTAQTRDFIFYKIQYMPDRSHASPDGQWGELYQRKTPVPSSERLMDWRTDTVEPGVYWIRLLVTDRTGNYQDQPCELRLVVTR